MKALLMRALTPGDAPQLSAMLLAQPADYIHYFHPFDFDAETIRHLLAVACNDVYVGFFVQDELAGFFMLRGWDSGYSIPAYGVTVAQNFSGLGLATLSLDMSKTLCRLRTVQRLMLKVHPDNHIAKRFYEKAGFVHTGLDPYNANLIYHYDFT